MRNCAPENPYSCDVRWFANRQRRLLKATTACGYGFLVTFSPQVWQLPTDGAPRNDTSEFARRAGAAGCNCMGWARACGDACAGRWRKPACRLRLPAWAAAAPREAWPAAPARKSWRQAASPAPWLALNSSAVFAFSLTNCSWLALSRFDALLHRCEVARHGLQQLRLLGRRP